MFHVSSFYTYLKIHIEALFLSWILLLGAHRLVYHISSVYIYIYRERERERERDVYNLHKYIYGMSHTSEECFWCVRIGYLEGDNTAIFTSEHPATRETLKIDHFSIVTDKVVFGGIFAACVVYTKTIIQLGVGE